MTEKGAKAILETKLVQKAIKILGIELMTNKEIEKQRQIAYEQGKEDGRSETIKEMDILGLVNFKAQDNPINRKRIIEIDYADCLNPEQIVFIILEQLKGQKND